MNALAARIPFYSIPPLHLPGDDDIWIEKKIVVPPPQEEEKNEKGKEKEEEHGKENQENEEAEEEELIPEKMLVNQLKGELTRRGFSATGRKVRFLFDSFPFFFLFFYFFFFSVFHFHKGRIGTTIKRCIGEKD